MTLVAVQSFLVAHWGLILSYLSIGTAATRGLDWLAKNKFPALKHAAAVVDELATDVIDVVTAVGKLLGQILPKGPGGPSGGLAALVLAASLLVGCSGTPPALTPGQASFLATAAHAVGQASKFAQDAAKLAPVVLDAVDRAKRCQAEVKTDPMAAAATCYGLIQDFRAAGVPIPPAVSSAADFLGAIAATDIEQGMRALSKGP